MRSPASKLLPLWPALRVESAGLFVSSGEGRHPTRTLKSYEFILVRSGLLRLCEEGQFLTAKPGEVLILHPERCHRGAQRYPSGLSFYWLHFRLPSRLAREVALPRLVVPARPDRVAELFHWFLDDQQSNLLDVAGARSLVLLLLGELFRPLPVSNSKAVSWLTSSVESSLAEDLAHRPRLDRLAKKLGHSADYINRAFKETKGKTIPQFIRERRILEARWLLIESDLLLKEIAQRCGYANASHFTRSFQAATGLTPKRFRALYPGKHINLH